jgi:hypothetical protein
MGILILCALTTSVIADLDLAGGEKVVIIGQSDSKGSVIYNISSHDIKSRGPIINVYRDPSQYTAPPTVKPTPPDRDTGSPEKTPTSSRSNSSFRFEISGSSSGEGAFYDWRSIDDVAGLSLKQTASSTYGNHDRSNRLVLLNDRNFSDFSMTFIASENQVRYSGSPYRTLEIYKNEKDYIRNYNEVGQILADSYYFGGWDKTTSDNMTKLNKLTLYRIDAGYIGTSRLNANLSDRPFLISEEYSGNMIQKTKVEKKQTFNETFAEENWMRRL